MATKPLRDELGYNVTGALNEVTVCRLSQLPEPSAGVITLEPDTEYRFCGIVDIEGNRLVGQLNTVLCGGAPMLDGVRTSNAAALLTLTVGITCSGMCFTNTGGPVFALSGVGAIISLRNIAVLDSVSCGTLENCTRVSVSTIIIEGCADGLTFDGAITDAFLVGVFCRNNTGTFVGFTLPDSLTIGLFIMSVGFIETDVGQTAGVIDDNATITSLVITELDVETPLGALGQFSTPVESELKAQPRARLTNNPRQPDSTVRGGIAFTSNTAEDTVITTQSVFVTIGTGNGSHPLFVADAGSERTALVGASATVQVLRYTGVEIYNGYVSISLTIEPALGGPVQFAARLTLDGVLVTNSVFQSTSNAAGQPGSLSFDVPLEIENLEELQIEIANETNTNDLTVLAARITLT